MARIESLRALAAVGVVSAHALGATGANFFVPFQNRVIAGWGFGALFFFSLSGALLYLPFVRRDFGGGSPVSLRRYALNRAVRIFPLYWVAVVVTLIVLHGGGTLEQWVVFFLFLENFSTEHVGQVHGALWTIVIELHFYLLLPFLAWFIARLSRGSVRRALLLLLAMAAASIVLRAWGVLLADRPYADPIRFSLPTTFYFIAVGMMVALLREAWKNGRPAWVRGPLALPDVWLVGAFPFWFIFVYHYDLEPFFAVSCFLILGAALLPLDRSLLIRVLDWKPLALLGLTSYSLYIWHVPLMEAIITRDVPVVEPLIDELHTATGSHYFATLAVTLPISIAMAIVSYKLIEAPALRLRKRWSGARGRPSGPPDAAREPAAAPASS